MSVTLYNEGRVLGLSAYEAFVRLFLADPNNAGKQPPDEKEWLASSIASGSSILVKVPIKTVEYVSPTSDISVEIAPEKYHAIDILLPKNTSLCAANTITACFVDVEVAFAEPYVTEAAVPAISGYEPGELVTEDNYDKLANNISSIEFINIASEDLPNITFAPNDAKWNNDPIPATLVNQPYNLMRLNWAPKDHKIIIRNWNDHAIPAGSIKFHFDTPIRVTCYQDQIAPNNSTIHPEDKQGYNMLPSYEYPKNILGYTQPPVETIERINNYLKIQDGVILQDSHWRTSSTWGVSEPTMYATADVYQPPMLRLLCKGKITRDFYLLLTGFTNDTVIAGTSTLTSSVTMTQPQNGTFLGPAMYPWANKVVFIIDNVVMRYTLPEVLRQFGSDLSYENNVYSLAQDKTIGVGTNYIEFNGLRLYISSEEPNDNDIPDGSIGIGWTAPTPGV